MKKKILYLSLIITLLGLVASCGKKEEVKNPVDQKEELVVDQHYPVTITTYDYNKNPIDITFEQAPSKVVAIYQNSIETLLALGLEDKIVLASGLDHPVKDDYAYQFETINYSKNIPGKEDVIGVQPDFILSWYSLFDDKQLGDVDFWHERGINTYIAQNSGIAQVDSLENEYNDILNLGKIFNVEAQAQALVDDMKAKIETAARQNQDKEKQDTIIVEVLKDNMYRVYGQDSIGGNIASSLGANLVDDKNGNIGAEDLIGLDPQVIFTVYYGDNIDEELALASFYDNPALASIRAVKDKRVYPIMVSEVYASGVRTLDGINSMIEGLYPNGN